MRLTLVRSASAYAGGLFVLALALAACGGGGGSSSSGGGGGITPPTPVPSPGSASQSVPLGTTQQAVTFGPLLSGASGLLTFPATQSGSATAAVTEGNAVASGDPTPSLARFSAASRRRMSLGVNPTVLLYFTVAVPTAVTFNKSIAATLTFAPGQLVGDAYIALYEPNNASAGWNALVGPGAVSGNTVTFAATTFVQPLTLQPNIVYDFAIVENGTPLATPPPITTTSPGAGEPTLGPTIAPAAATEPRNSGWGPYAPANAFQFPVQSGYNGTRVTVAIIGDAAPAQSDIVTYLSQNGITQNTPYRVENVNGGPTPPADVPGSQEATLDVETVAGLAPGANIVFYDIPDLSSGSFDAAYNQVISDQQRSGAPTVMSISFGGCESPQSTTDDTFFATGAAQGIAFVASAGDQGNECFTGAPTPQPQYTPGANSPASDPNVIGVGGTESDSLGNASPSPIIANNVAWNDALGRCAGSANQCATGGGVSGLFTTPPYQVGLVGEQSTTQRNVPDIALPAAVDGVYQSGWNTILGTSWSAPQAAAMIAEIYEYCGVSSMKNPVNLFYNAFKLQAYNDFIDVTGGNNRFGSSSPYYFGQRGFDNVSGIGMPLGMPIATTLCPNNIAFANRAMPGAAPATASLAAARPTALANVPNLRYFPDLGERAGGASVRLVIVLRDTPSLALNESTVVSQLSSAGFSIVGRYANHLVVDAQAPSSLVESYFGTRIHDVSQGQYGTRYANVDPLVLPASIAPYIQGIVANDLITMHPL